MEKKIIILFTLLNMYFIYAQFNVKKLSQQVIDNHRNKNAYIADYSMYKKKAYSAEKMLPQNYKKDGSVDYTQYIQHALDKYNVVLLPNFLIKVNDKGLVLHNNQVLLFQPKSALKLNPTSQKEYSVLGLNNVNKVKIYFANIEGDKYQHLTNVGEWGFGIGIFSSNDISIYSPYIKQTWGDGIYIGQRQNIPSTYIKVYNAVIDDVRRNGMSITSADNVNVVNTYISNTNGTSPESGIDIEPDSMYDVISNINVKNLTTYNNKWAGVLLVFERLKSVETKLISIDIEGHRDDFSQNAIAFHGYLIGENFNNLKGTIKLFNTNYKNNKTKYYFYKTNLSNLKINTSDLNLKTKLKSYNFK
ncbi:right-handed parallel beta-helix repeat-containing protein [Chryseobacterium schmidteae]|uniref:right-handed parallel beta-helix repeat-containing protein n=1 Tax=Chryseobacterium schmidteae TaxID=2730404 RepID=UPI0015894573|nr:right-handed parallel beta-helix repeat-containing protein [Chryseobacterium schmidteae]